MFGLGGTIAMTGGAGVRLTLSAEQLVAAVPGLAENGIDVEVEDFRRVPGASLSFDDLDALVAAVGLRLDGGVDGVVVTQGADTIEETAYFLDLAHTRAQPIVVTGAMRNPTLAGADGPGNLLAAIRTAASPAARDLGDDGTVLDAIADRADGLVVAAFGVGHVPSRVVERLGEVADRSRWCWRPGRARGRCSGRPTRSPGRSPTCWGVG